MKAYTMGRRAKWKDYVDLYFIIRYHYSIPQICEKAKSIFGAFHSGQFVEQLAYHEDINYAEPVEYLIPDPPTDTEVKRFLLEKAIED
jgi:esterase/lipase superfamily enzyme